MNTYLNETELLDYSNSSIQKLIEIKQWNQLDDVSCVQEIYNYVRDAIKFGYNTSDTLTASQILNDGFGQCNTKATLLMALLRAVDIPCRIHGFTIDKALQKGAISGIWYLLSPKNILHSWVEVFVNDQWYFLEGVILDSPYLQKIQLMKNSETNVFCGYGVFTDNITNPTIEWNLNHTYIQNKGISADFGVFNSPDAFYANHQQNLNPLKKFIFKHWVRHVMNENVDKIRKNL